MLFSLTRETFENCLSTREGFRGDNGHLALLLALLVWLAVLLFAAKYLWNEVLVKLVTFAKPVTNVLHLLGLVVLLDILCPK